MKDPIEHDDMRIKFYKQTIERVNEVCNTSDDLCFVYVQHAFSPLIPHISCLRNRLAAVILKASSSGSNRLVVQQLEEEFPRRVYADINRGHLRNTDFTLNLLKHVTQGRPFAILEYGGYFAPSAEAIANDPELGPKLVGFVEGTENGIKGADDGSTIGYQQVAHNISKPIISKSKSRIKKIMDRDIGPAIIESCNNILRQSNGHGVESTQLSIGIIGLGSIGKGILRHLNNDNIQPLVFDLDIAVMADLAHSHHSAVPQTTLLAKSDLVFLNTGSCFLAQQPELLKHIKENAILVLCTSGDVEAGIPQLIAAKHIELVKCDLKKQVATYKTRDNKSIRIMLGGDSIGQAPNLVVESGSGSLANLMSDMEFYALGCYLASNGAQLPGGCISDSPLEIQDLIFEQWLQVFHPECSNTHHESTSVSGLKLPHQTLVSS
jgi:S-adenosylhomocysteine hydrolase